MGVRPDILDKDEHARILRERIIPNSGLAAATSQEHPKAVILAGQPGAGKGSLASAAERELQGDVVSVDPDDLRRFHPQVRAFRRESPWDWSSRTHVDASAWADELLDATSSARKNLIFDTTLSDGKWASEVLIKGLQERGYEVEVRVVAAHKIESELGVDKRFTEQLDQRGYGRYVPKAVRDAIYDKIPASLAIIQAETDVGIRIYNRDGDELHYSKRDSELSRDALNQARNENIKDPEVTRDLRNTAAQQVRWHRSLPEHAADIPGIDALGKRQLLKGHETANILAESLVRAEGNATVDALIRPGAPPARVPVPEPEIPGLRRAGVAAGIAGLGIAASAYDAHETGQRVSALLQQQNAAAAQSELNHFAARGIGGWAGGAVAASAVGSSGAGPLLLIAADAYLFSKAAEKAVDLADSRAIYHQRDKQGWEWEYDGRNWVREVALDRSRDGVDQPIRQDVSANYEKARELGAYANRVAVGQMLAKAPAPQNPFDLPARPSDQRGLDNQNWHRDPHTDQWVRQVKTGVAGVNDRGTYTAEVATSERALALNQEARARIEDNIANGREAVAAAYLQTHAALRHQDFINQIPDAVAYARAAPDVVVGSDNQRYHRSEAGEWLNNGNVAQGNLALELELTRQLRQPWLERSDAALAELQASPAPTPAQVERNELLHRYQTYNVRVPDDWLPAIELASQRTRESNGITGHTLQELQPDAMGLFSAHSAIVHYQADADGLAHKVATTSTDEIRRAYTEVQARQMDRAPVPDSPELRIAALSPQEWEAHQQALREANRQGASIEEAAQAATLAALQVREGRMDAVRSPSPALDGDRPPPAPPAPTAPPQVDAEMLAARHAALASEGLERVTPLQDAPRPVQTPALVPAEDQRLQREAVPASEGEGDHTQGAKPQHPTQAVPPASEPVGAPLQQVPPAAEQPRHEPPHAVSRQERAAQPGQSTHAQMQDGRVPTTADTGVRAASSAEVRPGAAPDMESDRLAAPTAELVAQYAEEARGGLSTEQPLAVERPEARVISEQDQAAAVGLQISEQQEPHLLHQHTAPATPLTPLQPQHPDHALYQQICQQVTELDAAHGRSFDETSERLTGSLLVLAKSNGLERVDHVVLSGATADQRAGYSVFVVQGELDNPGHLRAGMPTQQAVQTPFEESLQQFDVVAQEQQERAKQVALQQDAEDQRVQQEMQVAAASMGY